eukprot:TRINITY_DN3745_c2_g1_i2.p1 TRINITY_DN3745_c2_g1~~TRINITY_DN3745_c2_g1_i2.p1  ORF type:complete len:123 (-),score=3.49 TRINITY_DN3745_c2_g1_i2:169-537(-)
MIKIPPNVDSSDHLMNLSSIDMWQNNSTIYYVNSIISKILKSPSLSFFLRKEVIKGSVCGYYKQEGLICNFYKNRTQPFWNSLTPVPFDRFDSGPHWGQPPKDGTHKVAQQFPSRCVVLIFN